MRLEGDWGTGEGNREIKFGNILGMALNIEFSVQPTKNNICRFFSSRKSFIILSFQPKSIEHKEGDEISIMYLSNYL